MNLPSGLIFYLDFKYGTSQGGFWCGNEVFGVTSGSGDPSAGLYGAGFGYSINDKHTSFTTVVTLTHNEYGTGSVSFIDVDFEPSLSSSLSNLRQWIDENNVASIEGGCKPWFKI